MHYGRDGVEAVPDHLDALGEVGAGPVHLVDEADPRHFVLVGLAPHRFGLRLHASYRIEDSHRPVEDPQGALHFHCEVDVSRGIDDVDGGVVPQTGGCRRRNGDSTLLFLDHPVHGGGTLVHFTDLVVLPGVVEDALGCRRLSGINMSHDPDIPGMGQGMGPGGLFSHN